MRRTQMAVAFGGSALKTSSPNMGEVRGGGSRVSVADNHHSLPPPRPAPMLGAGE